MQTTRIAGSHPKLGHPDAFITRHVGPPREEIDAMLETIGYAGLDALIDAVVPADIRLDGDLALGEPRSEGELLDRMRELAKKNQVWRSYIGMGYSARHAAGILRNILENPGWYTQYTPYQAEISQGRLEALLNFQTMICDLTGLEIANASLLDEGTAAAEAMPCATASTAVKTQRFFVSERCHPQTIAVVRTRAEALGIEVVVGDHETPTSIRAGRHLGVQSAAVPRHRRPQHRRLPRRIVASAPTRPARWSSSRPTSWRSPC